MFLCANSFRCSKDAHAIFHAFCISAAGICYNIFFNISKVNHKWLNLSIIRPSKFGGYQIVFHDQNLSLTRGSFSSSTEIYVLQEEVFWHGNISCATQSWQRLQKRICILWQSWRSETRPETIATFWKFVHPDLSFGSFQFYSSFKFDWSKRIDPSPLLC